MTWRLDHDGHQRLLARAIGGDKDIARIIGRLHIAECLITKMLMVGKFEMGHMPKLYRRWRLAGGRCVGFYYADNHFDKVFNVFLGQRKAAGE